jgi:thymidylate synthase
VLIIRAKNVNDAYDQAVVTMETFGVPESSRNGDVKVAPSPVVTEYEFPQQRVLLNEYRDANPFFHLFESLWMLSGSDDATWLDHFVGDFSSRFAEEDGRQWGAYGYRWRQHFQRSMVEQGGLVQSVGIDQLDVIVGKLMVNPDDRRVVISMWDPELDLVSEWSTESGRPARDVPCNTQIYPRIVQGRLELTIMCRSNDVVWGCYGANAVHFSVLHEYLAGRIGVAVGRMFQISNNWHLYDATAPKFKRADDLEPYPGHVPMGNNWLLWDDDLSRFMDAPESDDYVNEWFLTVARPMWVTHSLWKSGLKDAAMENAATIGAPDWRLACLRWMGKRL